MSHRRKAWEAIETVPHATQTVYTVGMWLTPDGTGAYIPATATDPIKGLCLESIAATDAEYITATYQIHYDGCSITDRFVMPVTIGSAVVGMIGSPFDLDTAVSLDVSGAGTQFEITQVFSTTLVEVRVLLFA